MKKLLLSLIAISLFVSPAFAQQDTVVEEIVARVNNAIITRADLRRNREQAVQDSREMNLTQAQVEARDANSLRDLIDQQLLIQKAADLGISADADLVKRLDDIRKEMKVGSMEDLQKMAESQGVSWEEFKQNTKNGILTQKVIGSEVGSHIQVTKDEAQKFYEEHKAEISQPERVRLSEILIANNPNAPKPESGKESRLADPTPEQVAAAEAKASEIYEQLKKGAKFDELARKESNGSTAEQGGDLGYFKRKDLAKELEDKSFALKAGEFTEPIHTRQGFIILRVADHIQAGTPPPSCAKMLTLTSSPATPTAVPAPIRPSSSTPLILAPRRSRFAANSALAKRRRS
jgi:peptidyl-prolyl cis-trans isomerase SurA